MCSKKVVVNLSGGMDSAVALGWALDQGYEVLSAICFNYGSKHNDIEWLAAQKVAAHYKIPVRRIDLPFVNELFKSDLLKSGGEIPEGHYADESMKKTVVPFRNGIMLAISAGYAESEEAHAILLGNHFGDHAIYPDCRKPFADAMAEAIAQGTYAKIEMLTPFCMVDKTEIARIGHKLQVPFHLTYSCYKGGKNHCGKCGTCSERIEAFHDAGLVDPTVYEQL